MRGLALALAAALACGCALPAAKSRIEPQERVLIELRGEEDLALDLPGSDLDAREVEVRFQALLKRELVKRRSLAPNRTRADALLAARLIGVGFTDKGGDAALRITAAARVETGGDDPGKPRAPWQASEYDGPARPRSEWTAGGEKMLDEELELGLGRIANDLVAGAIRAKEAK